jgi:hypothetical protein
MGVAYLLLWFVIVRTFIPGRPYRWLLYIIGVGSVLEFSARPELLASCIIVLGAIVFIRASDNRLVLQRSILTGTLLGALIVTHPAVSLLSAVLISATVAYLRREDARFTFFFLEGLACIVSATCVAVLLLYFLYPFSPTLWLEGIYEQGLGMSKRTDSTGFLKYFVTTKMFPMLILPLISLAIILTCATKQRAIGKNLCIFAFFTISVTGFSLAMYFLAIRIPATFYYFSVFVPAIGLLCFYFAAGQHQYIVRSLYIIPIAAFALACSSAQLVLLAQKIYYASDYDRLAFQINSLVTNYSGEKYRIAIDPPVATAIDDVNVLTHTRLIFFNDLAKQNNNVTGADVLIRAQTELGSLPVANSSFALVEDEFHPGPIARFIKPESLYFAVYEATSPRTR